MIPLLTSDGREGLPPGEIASFIDALEGRFSGYVRLRGLQACFGCANDRPPSARQQRELADLAATTAQRTRGIVLSLGGSVVLPQLQLIPPRASVAVEIRCGEAILTGTIPGRGAMFGLRRTARLDASVIQRRGGDDGGALVVDRGGFNFAGVTGTHVAIRGARIVQSTSEHSVVWCPPDIALAGVAQVTFVLGYSDMTRCLETKFRAPLPARGPAGTPPAPGAEARSARRWANVPAATVPALHGREPAS